MKVVVDSFKGSLGSKELSKNIELGILEVFPEAQIKSFSIADGGEGTVDALIQNTNGKIISIIVKNPLMQDIEAYYGILGNGVTAIIEMAVASGLPLVPKNDRNPMKTTSYGTGELIKDAIEKGCREFIIGIGGSATNDGGVGAL